MGKNIYFVLHTLSIGGAERHASSIANYLSQNGYKVKILLLDDSKVAYNLADGVEVVALCNFQYPDNVANYKFQFSDLLLLKFYKLFSKQKYSCLDKELYYKRTYASKLEYYFRQQPNIENSIVISFMPVPNISASMVSGKIRYKLIMGEFNSPHLEFAPDAPENKLKKIYFPNATGFVFQTEEQESFYTYLPNVRKEIIPNPIEDIKTQPFSGTRRKEIVNYCRLVKVKNIPLLVEAFAKLNNEYPEYSLVVYGEGNEKEGIEMLINQKGLEGKAVIKPFAKNVLDLVRDSAMFVTSSDREGISNSMLEAMAIGLPTISTDCPAGGAKMFIKSYENGIIVPVRDPEAMYQAMKYMIEHPDEAEEMGKTAVSIRQTLEKSKILDQWLSFVNSI